MGLLTKLWKMGADKTERDDPVTAVEHIAEKPEDWRSLDIETLKYLLYFEVLKNSSQPDPARFSYLFDITNFKLPPADRMALVRMIADSGETGETSWLSLMPFVFFDTDWQIVTAASLNCALLADDDSGESMGGVRRIISLAHDMGDEERCATLLGGLLSTGDRRVTELVFAELQQLGVQGARRLAEVRIMSAYSAVLELYADWIELIVNGSLPDGENHPVLRAICSRIASVPHEAVPSTVVEVKRAFPVTASPANQGVLVVRNWEFPEFKLILKRRLADVLQNESEPHLVRQALEQWTD